MTLPEFDEAVGEEKTPVQEAVVAVVKQAAEAGRVVCCLHTCIQLLARCHEEVMLCLLAKSLTQHDASVQILHTLISAFCQENAIHLLHVQDQFKLTQLVLASMSQPAKGSDEVIKPPVEENSPGFSCIFIKFPMQKRSQEDDTVLEYVQDAMKMHSIPHVTLPD